MCVKKFASVFPITQIICISNFRSLSLIVNILWLFEKYPLGNVTTLLYNCHLEVCDVTNSMVTHFLNCYISWNNFLIKVLFLRCKILKLTKSHVLLFQNAL